MLKKRIASPSASSARSVQRRNVLMPSVPNALVAMAARKQKARHVAVAARRQKASHAAVAARRQKASHVAVAARKQKASHVTNVQSRQMVACVRQRLW